MDTIVHEVPMEKGDKHGINITITNCSVFAYFVL